MREVNTVHYKDVEDQQTPVGRDKKLEREYAKRKAHDCKQDVKVQKKFGAYCQKFIRIGTEFKSKPGGHLGRMGVAKHPFEFAKDYI